MHLLLEPLSRIPLMLCRHFIHLVVTLGCLSGTALAQVDPLSGIDFVTIGDPGNPNWTGGGFYNNNHGRVDYEYRIGRFEVTTAQWVQFMNAATDRPSNDRIPHSDQRPPADCQCSLG
jgi:hypothetical protein